mmetsp:Transcript_8955/g.22166  ORF Transcript_8955/g.22166 Transcript_8955/m.22166 type:complete len:102 (+) Transcript_8955:223-528(+)
MLLGLRAKTMSSTIVCFYCMKSMILEKPTTVDFPNTPTKKAVWACVACTHNCKNRHNGAFLILPLARAQLSGIKSTSEQTKQNSGSNLGKIQVLFLKQNCN